MNSYWPDIASVIASGFTFKHLWLLVGLIVVGGLIVIFTCWKIARSIRGYDD